MLNRPKRDPALIRKIKEWAYECLPISKDATVSIMELQCHEPDCEPLETVIELMEQKGKHDSGNSTNLSLKCLERIWN